MSLNPFVTPHYASLTPHISNAEILDDGSLIKLVMAILLALQLSKIPMQPSNFKELNAENDDDVNNNSEIVIAGK